MAEPEPEPERRRRRLRSSHGPGSPAEETMITDPVETAPIQDPIVEDAVPVNPAPADEPAKKQRTVFTGRPRGSGTDDREAERGLRGLVGSGSSQVSVGAAMRARDAARPSEAQLEEAEQTLTIVRRNWTPREELPRNR
jgi:hypothetical protein